MCALRVFNLCFVCLGSPCDEQDVCGHQVSAHVNGTGRFLFSHAYTQQLVRELAYHTKEDEAEVQKEIDVSSKRDKDASACVCTCNFIFALTNYKHAGFEAMLAP